MGQLEPCKDFLWGSDVAYFCVCSFSRLCKYPSVVGLGAPAELPAFALSLSNTQLVCCMFTGFQQAPSSMLGSEGSGAPVALRGTGCEQEARGERGRGQRRVSEVTFDQGPEGGTVWARAHWSRMAKGGDQADQKGLSKGFAFALVRWDGHRCRVHSKTVAVPCSRRQGSC